MNYFEFDPEEANWLKNVRDRKKDRSANKNIFESAKEEESKWKPMDEEELYKANDKDDNVFSTEDILWWLKHFNNTANILAIDQQEEWPFLKEQLIRSCKKHDIDLPEWLDETTDSEIEKASHSAFAPIGNDVIERTEETKFDKSVDSLEKAYSRAFLIPVRTTVHRGGTTKLTTRWMSPKRMGLRVISGLNDLPGVIRPAQVMAFVRDSLIQQTVFYLAEELDIAKLKSGEMLPRHEFSSLGWGIHLFSDFNEASNKAKEENKTVLAAKVRISKPLFIKPDKLTPNDVEGIRNQGHDSLTWSGNVVSSYHIFVFDAFDVRIVGEDSQSKQNENLEKSEDEFLVDLEKTEVYSCDDELDSGFIAKAVIKTPTKEDGSVDYENVPIGASIWVSVSNESSPLHGRPIILTKRPDGLFALTGGAGYKTVKDKFGVDTKTDALRHLVMTGAPRKSKRDEELDEIENENHKQNEPLLEKKKELQKYGKEELEAAHEAFNKAIGIENKLTVNDLKKQRDDIVKHAVESGLEEEKANDYASAIIRHYAAAERTVTEHRRRDVGLKMFTKLRQMQSGDDERQVIEELNSELDFQKIKIDLPDPKFMEDLTKEEIDNKVGDIIGESVTQGLNPNPTDFVLDEELKAEGVTLEAPKGKERPSIELGSGIKPLDIKDAQSLKESFGKFANYQKLKSEINAVKHLIKPEDFSVATPSLLNQMRQEMKATFKDISDDDVVEIEKSYDDQYAANNSAMSFYKAVGEFWSDEKSIREKVSRADNGFGKYLDNGAVSAFAALTGKYTGERMDISKLAEKTSIETAALITAFSLRDKLHTNLPQYNEIVKRVSEANSVNQKATEKEALAQHDKLRFQYNTIQQEKAKGTLTSDIFAIEAEISNLIEQKKNLGTALGSMQASAAFLNALIVARDAKDNEVSIDFGQDSHGAQLRFNEMNLGSKGFLDSSDPNHLRVVTSARALQRYAKGLEVVKDNYDANEKIKTNMANVFEDGDGKIFAKDYKVPLWKDKFVDEQGNTRDYNFRVEQRNDIEFLKKEGNGVITRTTGAGKTNTSLGFFAHKISGDKTYSGLAVVPKGRVKQWIEEAKRFTDLDIVEIPEGTNQDERAKLIANIKSNQVAIISQRDAVMSYYSLEAAVGAGAIKGMVIDEPQEIASRSVKGNMSASIRKLTKMPVENRIVLTATPARDNLIETYDLVNWVSHHNKGLGPRTRFQRAYAGYGSATNAQDATLQQMIFKEIAPYVSGDKLTNPNFKTHKEDVIVSKSEKQNVNMRNIENGVSKYIEEQKKKFVLDIENKPDEAKKWEGRYGKLWRLQALSQAGKRAKQDLMSQHENNLQGVSGDMTWQDNPKIKSLVDGIRDTQNEKQVIFLDNSTQRKAVTEGLMSLGWKGNQIKNIASTTMSDPLSGSDMAKRVKEFRSDPNAKVIFIDKQSSSGYNLQEGNILHVVGKPSDAANYLQAQGRIARMPRVGDVHIKTYRYNDVPFEDMHWNRLDSQLKVLKAVAPGFFVGEK